MTYNLYFHRRSKRIGLRKDFKGDFFGESWTGISTLPKGASEVGSPYLKASTRDLLDVLTELLKLGHREDKRFPPI